MKSYPRFFTKHQQKTFHLRQDVDLSVGYRRQSFFSSCLINDIANKKMPLRKITVDEERLLEHMISLARIKMPATWKETLMVEPMDDGGMGSLVLHPQGQRDIKRTFGSVLSEYEFKDVDRAAVVVTLNADQHGQLFELDVWKTTFEPLKEIPREFN